MKVLMVCLGNICRSPLAQGILEHKLAQKNLLWEVDSAGTSNWHTGHSPDLRSIAKAKEYNINIENQKARQITTEDLDYYDLILAMDTSNFQNISNLVTNKEQQDKIKLVLNYVYPGQNMAVPDPYFDGGFQKVYDLLNAAMDEIIAIHG